MTISGRTLPRTEWPAEGSAFFRDARLPPSPVCPATLARAADWLRGARLDWACLGPRIAFAAAGYARQTLAIEDGWEVALCCWLPGQASPLHDHGVSMGVVRLLAGSLTETRYRPHRGGLVPEEPWTACAGETMEEHRDVFHRVVNDGAGPAVSLHLYNPPLLRGALPH